MSQHMSESLSCKPVSINNNLIICLRNFPLSDDVFGLPFTSCTITFSLIIFPISSSQHNTISFQTSLYASSSWDWCSNGLGRCLGWLAVHVGGLDSLFEFRVTLGLYLSI